MNQSPIEYPTANIGGVPYTLRFSYAATRRARNMGALLNVEQIQALTPEQAEAIDFKLIAAAAGNLIDNKWVPIALDYDQIAEVIFPAEAAPLKLALKEAITKAAQAAMPATPPAIVTTPDSTIQ